MRCDTFFSELQKEEIEVRMEATHMYRATTPTHIFWFNSVNPETYFKKILITYVQDDSIIFEKNKEDLTFGMAKKCGVDSYYGLVTLTQAETNLISTEDGSNVEIQMRVLDYAGNVDASNAIRITASEVLNDEVLT